MRILKPEHRRYVRPTEKWELHIGTTALYILGDGMGNMHRVSKTYYKSRIGSDAERDIARRAVIILNTDLQADCGLAEVTAALAAARTQRRADRARASREALPTTAP